jgi:hypothetical protein
MALSAAHREAYARVDKNVLHLNCIELRHSVLGIMRLVDYDKDVDLLLEADAPANPGITRTFIGTAGEVARPSSNAEVDSPFSMLLDGVSGYLQPWLYNANQYQEIIPVTVRSIGYNIATETVIGVAGIIHLELLGAKVGTTDMQLTSGYSNSTNVAFPGVHYTPESNPGLY